MRYGDYVLSWQRASRRIERHLLRNRRQVTYSEGSRGLAGFVPQRTVGDDTRGLAGDGAVELIIEDAIDAASRVSEVIFLP